MRYDNNPALTEIFHGMSLAFPAGEMFFIDSVMHYALKLVNDHPELWKEVPRADKREGERARGREGERHRETGKQAKAAT